MYLTGISRVHNQRNYDFIKHKGKFPEAIREIYKRFGILNLFNPFRPNGSYRLDLGIYEEKVVCKILLELAKTEDLKQMTNVVMDGSPIEAIDKDFVANLPEKGTHDIF